MLLMKSKKLELEAKKLINIDRQDDWTLGITIFRVIRQEWPWVQVGVKIGHTTYGLRLYWNIVSTTDEKENI